MGANGIRAGTAPQTRDPFLDMDAVALWKGELDHLVRAGFLKKGDAAYKSAEQALRAAETEKNPGKKERILGQVETTLSKPEQDYWKAKGEGIAQNLVQDGFITAENAARLARFDPAQPIGTNEVKAYRSALRFASKTLREGGKAQAKQEFDRIQQEVSNYWPGLLKDVGTHVTIGVAGGALLVAGAPLWGVLALGAGAGALYATYKQHESGQKMDLVGIAFGAGQGAIDVIPGIGVAKNLGVGTTAALTSTATGALTTGDALHRGEDPKTALQSGAQAAAIAGGLSLGGAKLATALKGKGGAPQGPAPKTPGETPPSPPPPPAPPVEGGQALSPQEPPPPPAPDQSTIQGIPGRHIEQYEIGDRQFQASMGPQGTRGTVFIEPVKSSPAAQAPPANPTAVPPSPTTPSAAPTPPEVVVKAARGRPLRPYGDDGPGNPRWLAIDSQDATGNIEGTVIYQNGQIGLPLRFRRPPPRAQVPAAAAAKPPSQAAPTRSAPAPSSSSPPTVVKAAPGMKDIYTNVQCEGRILPSVIVDERGVATYINSKGELVTLKQNPVPPGTRPLHTLEAAPPRASKPANKAPEGRGRINLAAGHNEGRPPSPGNSPYESPFLPPDPQAEQTVQISREGIKKHLGKK